MKVQINFGFQHFSYCPITITVIHNCSFQPKWHESEEFHKKERNLGIVFQIQAESS